MHAAVFNSRVSAFAITLANENALSILQSLDYPVVITMVIVDNQQANTVDAAAELIVNSCAAIRYTHLTHLRNTYALS